MRLEDKREQVLLSLEKRRLWRGFITGFQYLKMACKIDGEWLFTQADGNRARENHFKQKEERFKLHSRRTFFSKMLRHWHQLPKKSVDAPYLVGNPRPSWKEL